MENTHIDLASFFPRTLTLTLAGERWELSELSVERTLEFLKLNEEFSALQKEALTTPLLAEHILSLLLLFVTAEKRTELRAILSQLTLQGLHALQAQVFAHFGYKAEASSTSKKKMKPEASILQSVCLFVRYFGVDFTEVLAMPWGRFEILLSQIHTLEGAPDTTKKLDGAGALRSFLAR